MSKRIAGGVTTTRHYLHRWADSHPSLALVLSTYCGRRFGWRRLMDPHTGRWRGPWRLDWQRPL